MELPEPQLGKFFVHENAYYALVSNTKHETGKVLLGSTADIEKTGEIIRAINPDYSQHSNDELLSAVIPVWPGARFPFIAYVTIYVLRDVINLEKKINREIIPPTVFYDALVHLARHNPEYGALYLFLSGQERVKKYLATADQQSFDTLYAGFGNLPVRNALKAHINQIFSSINRKNA